MRIITSAICLSAIATAATATATPETQPERHDTLRAYQTDCNPANGFTTFLAQVGCIKALIVASTNPASNSSDAPTRMYLASIDKLADDVRKTRITSAAARVQLQLALQDAERRQREETNVMEMVRQAQSEAAERVRQEADRAEQRHEEEVTQQREAELAQAQRRQAIRLCIEKVNERFSELATHGDAFQQSNAVFQRGFTNVPMVCERDPNYYQSMPPVPVVTKCAGSNDDGYVQLNCTTN
jgi:exonuclease VII large subunit